MNDLMTVHDADRIPIDQIVRHLRASRMVPPSIRSDDALKAIILMANELGIAPYSACRQIYVIDGLPSCSAQLMLALANKRLPEFQHEIAKSDSETCTMRMRRDPTRPWMELTYTFKQAQQAGLTNKRNWKASPDDMLRNRVVSKLLRMVAPDVFAGIYSVDEAVEAAAGRRAPPPDPEKPTPKEALARVLSDEDPPGVTPVTDDLVPDGVPVDVDPEVDHKVLGYERESLFSDWSAAVEQAGSLDDLKALWFQIEEDTRLRPEDREELRAACGRRRKEVEA